MPVQDPQEFFDELKEWSERKLNILEKYLDPFVKILGSLNRVTQVYYVDAFAGAGIYRDGEKGSALRAAELAQLYHNEGKHYRLHCINIEADQENYQNLQSNTQAVSHLVSNLNGTFEDNVDTVLDSTTGAPALFFLDPFGVKPLDWKAVHKVIQRGFGTDLWIRFDYTAVSRLRGGYKSTDAGAIKSFDILCQVYGINDRDELHILLDGATSDEKRDNAVNLYMDKLQASFESARGEGYVGSYTIRAITEENKYFLIFATSHPRGAIIASEVVAGIEETYQRELEEYKASQRSQIAFSFLNPSEDELFQDKVIRLQEDIWNLCQNQELSRTEIYVFVLEKWFGKLKSRHINAALKALIADGRIVYANGAVSANHTKFQFRYKSE